MPCISNSWWVLSGLGLSLLGVSLQSQSNHRPNFAKLLKERTEEEKEHASVLAKFQVERGAAVKVKTFHLQEHLANSSNKIMALDAPGCDEINTIEQAIDAMLKAEVSLTEHLVNLKKIADEGAAADYNHKINENDPLVDAKNGQATHISELMSTYLADQAKDIHELRIMKTKYAQFANGKSTGEAELLFDKLML